MKSKTIILLGILVLSFLQGASASSVSMASKWGALDIEVKDAYYTSLDSDGLENDVKVIMKIAYEGTVDLLVLKVGLILPSGYTTTYDLVLILFEGKYIGVLEFFNEATEQGWYTFFLEGSLFAGRVSGQLQHDFDPPEEKLGGDPSISFSLRPE